MVFAGYAFVGCPVRALDARLAAHVIVRLWKSRAVAPLSDYPNGLAAWVSRGLVTLSEAVEARAREDRT